MQSRDDCVRGVNERIITIVGGENFVLQAVGRILKKCLEDPAFEEYRTQSLAAHSSAGMMHSGLQVLPSFAGHTPCSRAYLCAPPLVVPGCLHLLSTATALMWKIRSGIAWPARGTKLRMGPPAPFLPALQSGARSAHMSDDSHKTAW